MFLNLDKREFQHLVMQYILSNLEQYDDLMERSGSPDDLILESGQWKEEDELWEYFIRYLKRRNIENRMKQLWPRFEPRIKVMGRSLTQTIIDTRQYGNDSENKIKIGI